MYGKLFASAFTGSMYGAGSAVFAVWAYVIANTESSQVELNPRFLAGVIGETEDKIRGAIDFLCAPDPTSRSKVADGRRLIREGEFAYQVPNFAAYRNVRNEDDRREYNRVKKAEQRQRDKEKSKKSGVNLMKDPVGPQSTAVSLTGQAVSAMSAQAEAEAEAVPPLPPTPPARPARNGAPAGGLTFPTPPTGRPCEHCEAVRKINPRTNAAYVEHSEDCPYHAISAHT